MCGRDWWRARRDFLNERFETHSERIREQERFAAKRQGWQQTLRQAAEATANDPAGLHELHLQRFEARQKHNEQLESIDAYVPSAKPNARRGKQ